MIRIIISTLLLASVSLSYGQDIQEGESLFKSLCSACHETGAGRLIGPGLKGVSQKRERDWIVSFVQNSTDMIKAGDADAVAIFEEYNNTTMNSHDITAEQVDNIMAYVDDVATRTATAPDVAATSGNTSIQIREEFLVRPKDKSGVKVGIMVLAGFLVLISVFIVVSTGSNLSDQQN